MRILKLFAFVSQAHAQSNAISSVQLLSIIVLWLPFPHTAPCSTPTQVRQRHCGSKRQSISVSAQVQARSIYVLSVLTLLLLILIIQKFLPLCQSSQFQCLGTGGVNTDRVFPFRAVLKSIKIATEHECRESLYCLHDLYRAGCPPLGLRVLT